MDTMKQSKNILNIEVEMLTSSGWRNIHKLSWAGAGAGQFQQADFQQPFQLYREGDRTYLQWMGQEVLHQVNTRLSLVRSLDTDL